MENKEKIAQFLAMPNKSQYQQAQHDFIVMLQQECCNNYEGLSSYLPEGMLYVCSCGEHYRTCEHCSQLFISTDREEEALEFCHSCQSDKDEDAGWKAMAENNRERSIFNRSQL